MSYAARRRRVDAPTPKTLGTFLRHLDRSGSVAFAAARVGVSRNTLYRRRACDPVFAAGWAAAIESGRQRLLDEALQRSVEGVDRTIVRRGRKAGTIRDYDTGLLKCLLRLHWPKIYGRDRRSDGDHEGFLDRISRLRK